MDYELDIKKIIRSLEETIILRQQNVKALNEDLQGAKENYITLLGHITKIETVGAIEALKKERDKLVEMLRN